MIRNFYLYFICFIFFSCKKNEDSTFDLEIISNQLVMGQKQPAKNILRYRLTNKGSKIYYFNQFPQSKILGKFHNYIFLNNSCFVVKDSKKDTVKMGYGIVDYSVEYSAFLDNQLKPIRELGYTKNEEAISLNKNFLIHPNETLYFEELVYLPNDRDYRFYKYDIIKENSFVSIFMFSDTTKYKKAISNAMLETIKKNNYTVFHGIITSKNKIPINLVN